MRKIRASVLRKVEESRLTNKELTVFLHICQYQTDAGIGKNGWLNEGSLFCVQ